MKNSILLAFYLLIQTYSFSQSYATFSQVGPVKFPNNPSIQTTGMGRVSQLVYHPKDSNILFAVTASGGIFKSSNEGATWRPMSDYLPQTACASLAINPINPKVMYLGTGDANYNGGGFGIWKSYDGGFTWVQSTNGIGNQLVSYVLMTPNDTNTLIASCKDGIYKSTDAGATWTKKTSVNGSYRALHYLPSSNSILYAATDAHFYRSYNNGNTWIQSVVNGSITCAGIKIAVCPADTSKLFCVVWKSGTTSPFGGVYKSTNNGATFTLQADTPNILGYSVNGSSMDGQGAYNLAIASDPINANTLYITGINIWKSTDQGISFKLKSHWVTGVHADKHGILFSPYNPNKIFIYHDGGIDRSMDGGATWTTLEDGLSASEFYKMGNSGLYNDYIIGGLQDNGMDIAIDKEFSTVRGGDWGGDFAFDVFDSSMLYENGGIKRNIVTNNTSGINGQGGIYLVHPNDSNFMFEATTNLFRTKNLRVNPSSNVTWTQISTISGNSGPKAMAYSKSSAGTFYMAFNTQVLYKSDDINAVNPTFTGITTFAFNSGEQIKQLETCDYDSNVLYVLTSQSRLLKTNNKGITWISMNKNLPSSTIIKFLLDQKNKDSSMYVCNAFGVYYRNKFIKNWLNFSQGLPTVAQISDMEIMSDGTSKSRLHIATYGRGIWQTNLYASATLAPVADFTIQNASSQNCANTVILVDNSIYSPTLRRWQITPDKGWSFINGTDSLSPRPEIQFNTTGSYFISLIVSNNKGSNIKTINYNYTILTTPASCTTTTNIISGFGIGIYRFELNTIDKSSGAGIYSNEDFSCNDNTILKAGSTYTAWVTSGVYNNENAKIYIDYNNNGTFTDANELLGSIGSGMGRRSCTFTILVNPPVTNKFLRMRIVSDFSTVTAACGVLSYGQSEDYAISIDRTKPTVSITIPKPLVSNGFNAIFKTSEVVKGFDVKDIILSNGSIGTFTQTDAQTYLVRITPINNGKVKLTINANSFSDFAGNFNIIAEDSTVLFLGIKSFTFAGASVKDSITQTPSGGTITCNLPYGGSVDSLIATFILSDTSTAYIGAVLQISGISMNNFSNQITYLIKSKDGFISKSYIVNVKVNTNKECDLITYGFIMPAVSGTIVQTSGGGTIDINVPFGTSTNNLVALFKISDSANATVSGVKQMSGITQNDFTNPVIYIITAKDTNFSKTYLINVTIGKNKACDMLMYAIQTPSVNGLITPTGATGGNVSATLPIKTNLNNLTALFKVSDSANVYIGNTTQKSGLTTNNFKNTLSYKIVAQDTSISKVYLVTLIVKPDSASELLSYRIISPDDTGIITRTLFGGYVDITTPFATNLNNLIAEFTISDSAKAFVNGIQQQTGITPNDYSDTLLLKVRAQDNNHFKIYSIAVKKSVGVTYLNKKGTVIIYPNPVNEYVTIMSEDNIIENIKVFTLTGKEVYSITPVQKNCRIRVADWSNGVYIVKYSIRGLSQQARLIVNH